MRNLLLELNPKGLDIAILGSGLVASIVEWMVANTSVMAIWIGTIIVPATIRIWQSHEAAKDAKMRRKREDELHQLKIEQIRQELIQDQERHETLIHKGNG